MSPAPPARAIVSHGPVSEGKWVMEQVRLRDITADELVIRVVASGVCHTDLHFGGQKKGFGVVYPSVKGHEGELSITHSILSCASSNKGFKGWSIEADDSFAIVLISMLTEGRIWLC